MQRNLCGVRAVNALYLQLSLEVQHWSLDYADSSGSSFVSKRKFRGNPRPFSLGPSKSGLRRGPISVLRDRGRFTSGLHRDGYWWQGPGNDKLCVCV